MPELPSTRLGLPGPASADAIAVPAHLRSMRDALDTVAVAFAQGLGSDRPAPATAGRLYFATDDGALFYDTGSSWRPVTRLVTVPQSVGQPGGPAFGAGWVTLAYANLRFWKTGTRVHLAGPAYSSGGSVNAEPVFTFPPGFRPPATVSASLPLSNVTGLQPVTVTPAGEVLAPTVTRAVFDLSFETVVV